MLVVWMFMDDFSDQMSSRRHFPAGNIRQELKSSFGLLVWHDIMLLELFHQHVDTIF